MNILLNGYYFLLIIGALAVIFSAYNLQKKYPLKFISYFFYYLIATYIYWVLVNVLQELLYSNVGKSVLESGHVNWMLVFFTLPVTFITLYLFLAWFFHLREVKVPSWISRGFLLVAIFYTVGIGILLKLTHDSGDDQNLDNFFDTLYMAAVILRFSVIIFVFLGSLNYHGGARKKLVQTVCLYYFLGFAAYYLFGRIIHLGEYKTMVTHFLNFFYFYFNVPPLLLLSRYVKGNTNHFRHSLQGKVNFTDISQKYDLTKREQEIFLLMMEGKSNSEIKDKLFLSIKTVKNHIYSIYKKMGINNRTQLLAFLQDLYNGE